MSQKSLLRSLRSFWLRKCRIACLSSETKTSSWASSARTYACIYRDNRRRVGNWKLLTVDYKMKRWKQIGAAEYTRLLTLTNNCHHKNVAVVSVICYFPPDSSCQTLVLISLLYTMILKWTGSFRKPYVMLNPCPGPPLELQNIPWKPNRTSSLQRWYTKPTWNVERLRRHSGDFQEHACRNIEQKPSWDNIL